MTLSYRDRITALSRFRNEKFFTTSFFLDTDKARRNRKEILLAAKNFINDARSNLGAMDASRERKASLEKDLVEMEAHLARNPVEAAPGLAIYACSGAGFLEIFELPEAPRERLVVDLNPYIRPLSIIHDAHQRHMILAVDRREARWYEAFWGTLSPLASLSSEIPKKVRSGVEGTETKRIERRVEEAVHGHYKRAAQTTLDLLKKNGFAGLFLGGPESSLKDLEKHLHPSVRERIRGTMKAKPSDPLDKVALEFLGAERKLRKEEEKSLVGRLVGELEKGGRARSGLRDCLESLNKGEVQTLVVTRFFTAAGKRCPRCRLLYVDTQRCPSCERKTESRPDIVDEAIESAFDRQCTVNHVLPPSKLDRYGKIGVFLRYKS